MRVVIAPPSEAPRIVIAGARDDVVDALVLVSPRVKGRPRVECVSGRSARIDERGVIVSDDRVPKLARSARVEQNASVRRTSSGRDQTEIFKPRRPRPRTNGNPRPLPGSKTCRVESQRDLACKPVVRRDDRGAGGDGV